MKFLKLTDPHEFYFYVNTDHILALRLPMEGDHRGETEIVLASGQTQIVKESMKEILRLIN